MQNSDFLESKKIQPKAAGDSILSGRVQRSYIPNHVIDEVKQAEILHHAKLLDKKQNAKKSSSQKNKIILIIAVILFVIGIMFGVSFLLNKDSAIVIDSEVSNSPEVYGETPEEVTRLLGDVGKHFLLPEDTDLSVYTVTDLEPLQADPFFKNAEIGDKVLIWATARKAILYSPRRAKIIEVSLVGLAEPATSTPKLE